MSNVGHQQMQEPRRTASTAEALFESVARQCFAISLMSAGRTTCSLMERSGSRARSCGAFVASTRAFAVKLWHRYVPSLRGSGIGVVPVVKAAEFFFVVAGACCLRGSVGFLGRAHATEFLSLTAGADAQPFLPADRLRRPLKSNVRPQCTIAPTVQRY